MKNCPIGIIIQMTSSHLMANVINVWNKTVNALQCNCHSYLTAQECSAADIGIDENDEDWPDVYTCWEGNDEHAPGSYFTSGSEPYVYCYHCRVISRTGVTKRQLGMIGVDMQNCTEAGVVAGMP